MEDILRLPVWCWCLFLMGACIGSYLNVVIYRWPREELSVTKPARSFCPACKEEIPWFRNIPLLTWLIQRGKCAGCSAPISFRYFSVELLTAVLFLAGWYVFVVDRAPAHPIAGILVAILSVLLICIAWIDADLMVVPVDFCWWGMAVGVVGACLDPALVAMDGSPESMNWWQGGVQAVLGLALGWGGLSLVVYLGKKCMGIKRIDFTQAHEWYLREPESDDEQLCFVIRMPGKEAGEGFEEDVYAWGDLFFRDYDRLEIEGHGILMDGQRTKATRLVVSRETVEMQGEKYAIEDMKSLEGKATRVAIPREAMGDGDPPLLGLIGAFIGWHGVAFTLFAACVFAIIWAIPSRIGFGRQLPFGPFLALGGAAWIFGGWMLWEWYFESLTGFTPLGEGGR
jgi:leader peptidase (prepilin peptidase)/N-methyltransferase